MKLLQAALTAAFLLFILNMNAFSQGQNLNEIFKTHMNKTVQNVKNSDSAAEKRVILDTSFDKMLTAIERIENSASLTEQEKAELSTFKSSIEEKSNQLHGLKVYKKVTDENLDEFSEYSQQAMEQADRTLTLSLTTVLLVVIILLLL
jgi:hypothetical protein